MTKHRFFAPRIVLAGGFAVAALAAPVVATFAASAFDAPTPSLAACSPGESEDLYTNMCVPDLVPNSPAPFTTIPGNPDIPAID
ncbi:MAG TPA: intersectin-EH binding protein Ibp1, partial [Mycobacterium sp.]|nr:intersectin-EH binding protein Ibp1 [Mycobacterium sp.]